MCRTLLFVALVITCACSAPPATATSGASTGTPVPRSIATPTASVTPSPRTVATPGTTGTPRPSSAGWREVAPPALAANAQGQWIEVDAPNGRRLLANVLRPPGPGPFPVVVNLHGSGGFALSAITGLSYDIAAAGSMVVTGCWFSGASPTDPPPPLLLDCPNAPPFNYANLSSIAYARALVTAARALPGADPDRVGLTGQSRGATAALLLASTGIAVQAVVADSAGYSAGKGLAPRDTPPLGLVKDVAAPVLILHGSADATVPIASAREYESALRQLGKPVDSWYYEGATHVVQRKNSSAYPDALARTVAYFRRYLG